MQHLGTSDGGAFTAEWLHGFLFLGLRKNEFKENSNSSEHPEIVPFFFFFKENKMQQLFRRLLMVCIQQLCFLLEKMTSSLF